MPSELLRAPRVVRAAIAGARRPRHPGYVLRRSLGVGAALVALASCKDSSGPDVRVAALVVTPDELTMAQKEQWQLTVAAVDAEGLLLTGVPIAFEAMDEEMLSVSATGLVESIGRSGTTSVRALAGRVFKDVPVVVTPVPVGVELLPNPVALLQGQTKQLDGYVVDIFGLAVRTMPVGYRADGYVAAVSATGLVSAAGPRGTGWVEVFTDQFSARVPVVVTGVPTRMEIVPNPAIVGRNTTYQLRGAIYDAYGEEIPGHVVSFTSVTNEFATVSTSGLVTTSGTLGSFGVTAQSGSFTAEGTVEVREVARPSGTLTKSVFVGETHGVAISPSGVVYASALGGRVVRVDLPGFTQSTTITGTWGAPDVRFDATGSTAYVAGLQGDGVTVIDVATNTPTAFFPGNGSENPYAVELTPSGALYYGTSGNLYSVNRTTGAMTPIASGAFLHLTAHPEAPYLYASNVHGGVIEVDIQTNTVTRTFPTGAVPQATAVALDGSALYVAMEYEGTVQRWNLATGARTASVNIGLGGFGMALTRDGTQLYVANGNLLRIVDPTTLGVIGEVGLPSGGARRLAFDPIGSMAVITGGGGTLYLIQ